MTKFFNPWVLFILIGLAVLLAYSLNVHTILTLQNLQNHADIIANYQEQHPILTLLIFMGVYILSVTLSLPVATFLTLLGGCLFGHLLGTAIVVMSATIGATLIFLIARSSLGQALRSKASNIYVKVEKHMHQNAVGYLLFMRLVPLFPFTLVNIIPALFHVPKHIFIFTTLFGIIPGSFVYVNLGQQLTEISNIEDLVSS